MKLIDVNWKGGPYAATYCSIHASLPDSGIGTTFEVSRERQGTVSECDACADNRSRK